MFCRREGRTYFRINLEALQKYTEHFLANVAVHEFAHYAAYLLHGPKVGHGAQWRTVMVRLGAKPTRCHTYDLTPARVTNKVSVYCGCGPLQVSPAIARKLSMGAAYRCRKCKTRLSSAPAARQLTVRTAPISSGGVFVS
jgi:predicted SprT family Zn-dependent metalloprotease